MKFAAKLSNRAVITTGLGSTSAGLTVTAVKDGGKYFNLAYLSRFITLFSTCSYQFVFKESGCWRLGLLFLQMVDFAVLMNLIGSLYSSIIFICLKCSCGVVNLCTFVTDKTLFLHRVCIYIFFIGSLTYN